MTRPTSYLCFLFTIPLQEMYAVRSMNNRTATVHKENLFTASLDYNQDTLL